MPDQVRETRLEVRATRGGELVTVVEVLSPSNKVKGSEGRALYERKRLAILGTGTHLVEVDLTRSGPPMTVFGADRDADYRILVSRGDRRPRAELLLFSLRDAIPTFRLPLRPGDVEPDVELGRILAELYEQRAYDLGIDYGEEPVPPIDQADAAWVDERLREAGLR